MAANEASVNVQGGATGCHTLTPALTSHKGVAHAPLAVALPLRCATVAPGT